MELRQARLAAMALVLVLAGCSQLPSPSGSTAREPAPLRDAPQQIGNASDQLAELAEPVRTDTALAWARAYLVNERADDAGELLDQVGDGALSRDQRFRWLQLRAQSWMAEQQPDRAVALLDDYRGDIDGFDAQRRAKLNLLRADAQALNGELMKSLRQRVAVDPLLNDDDQAYNRQLTWEALMRLPLETLEARAEDTSGELRGWLELALLYRDPQANIDSQVQRLSRWRETWPDHPAARQLPETVRALQRAARERPQRVAVLLPESGPLAPAAEAIRDGMMTGYYSAEEAGNPTPDLRFYDVSDADVRSVFQRAVDDGAEFVVGPLSKENVAELARMGTPPVTVLALNYLDQDSADAPLFQFGLAPEDEARQIARQSLDAGDRLAGVLYPRSAWGQRVAQAFVTAWQDGGGRIVVESSFTEDTIGETVESLLDTARAEKDLRRDTSFSDQGRSRPEEWPRSLDFLFLVADPNEGRQIKPALNFHYARDLPVFATSHIYNGTPAPRRDQDLDGVYFLDMPWILYEGTKLHHMAEDTWPEGHGRYARLFAMGVDAYRLQARLYLLRNLRDSTLPGVTGTLRLDGARLVRESDWALFRNGEAVPVPRVGDGRLDSTQY
ncbi:MAG: penicillin-binding protein activator [Alcanivorax sp.]|nr:penicillin-binding protein activator [Alcanivorax sp.]